jgi:hypothetical protein
MAAAGEYAEESATQHGAAAFGFPLIPRAAESVVLPPAGEPLLLADFGAAQGTNSLEAMRRALAAFADRSAFVVHTDLPGNDFTTLARTLETSPDRYDRDRPDAVPLMSARSLYDRVFPAGRLHFGWTASTLHWLRAAPGPVRDHFFVQLSRDEDARRAYRDESQRDLRDFLRHRAEELAPGAGVVIVDVAMGDDGTMGSEALFDRLNDALVEIHERGLIDADELARMVYPTWFRSLDEVRAPFAEDIGLELAALEPVTMDDPFRAQLDDAEAYAAAQVGFMQGFLEPSFAAALSDAHRPALAEVWTAARRRIAADPAAVSPRYRLMTALVRRRA